MSNTEYIPVIGLEIHVQLATKSKMFERCSADWFGKAPNTVVGPLSLGLPGTLPVPNKKAIQWSILLGMALNCQTNKVSKFDRKHYFYPDLPKGYQISQYDQPFSYDGHYDMVSRRTGETLRIRIKRVHLEEDTGKLIHEGEESLVDFNRAGVPLCEIVTEPDFNNSEDVKQFLEELQVIVRYLGISEADMEKGTMRLEPNISLKKPGETDLPTYKVEVKNINSFNFAKRAIDFELKRHQALLEKGETPVQETRGYNESRGETVSQRVKEEAADYRYMPEPDIPPFEFDDQFLDEIRDMLPELPHQKLQRYTLLSVSDSDAYQVTRSLATVHLFENTIERVKPDEASLTFKAPTIEAEIAKMIVQKTITPDLSLDDTAKKVTSFLQPKQTDNAALQQAIETVLNENQDAAALYKGGKETILMFLVGQVMKQMKGQADAQVIAEKLKDTLK